MNAPGYEYCTALQAASSNCSPNSLCRTWGEGVCMYDTSLQASRPDHSPGGILKLLLERGADVNIKGGFYGTALQAASVGGNKNTVHMCLEHGFNVNAWAGKFGSALIAASNQGHKQIVELLLESGANANLHGRTHCSALIAATASGHKYIIEKLLERGADVKIWSTGYKCALQTAAQGGYTEIAQLLLAHSAIYRDGDGDSMDSPSDDESMCICDSDGS